MYGLQNTKHVTVRHWPFFLSVDHYSQYTSEFLISFEAWAKMAQKWLVCAIENKS